jgi:methylthioribose-1-phosphate isomerase
MEVDGQAPGGVRTVWWESEVAGGSIALLDQSVLPHQVQTLGGTPIAPAGVQVANPAFDVTPHSYVTALITEAGIARSPYTESLPALCAGYHHTEEV